MQRQSSSQSGHRPIGSLSSPTEPAVFEPQRLVEVAQRHREPCFVVLDREGRRVGAAFSGSFAAGPVTANGVGVTHPVLAVLGPLHPEWLGDRSFTEVHHVRFPYVTGAMANGIATTRLVIEVARAGFLGFFGAAGLGPDRVARALDELDAALGGTSLPWGANLIHSPPGNVYRCSMLSRKCASIH